MIGNKIADKIGKSKLVAKVNLRKVEEIVISPERCQEKLNELRKIL